ncbi:hypothetical protein [Streptacidiphilus anmyonensis]|uniref:hypothetical protein n=1 Tax=Streptacidiphilus anmyonensis TaxID=405782 RepID=UPI00128D3A96|nr:hypothetical protein [Streptacidiphilus anmyonensis]
MKRPSVKRPSLRGHALLTGAVLAATVTLSPQAGAAENPGHWHTLTCAKGQAAFWEPLDRTPGVFLRCDKPDYAASAVTTGMMSPRFVRQNAIAAQLRQDHDLLLSEHAPCRVGELGSVHGRFGQCVR